jgi:hypothetical protein
MPHIEANRREIERCWGAFNHPTLPRLRSWLRERGLVLYRDGVRALVDEVITRRGVAEQEAWATPLTDVADLLTDARAGKRRVPSVGADTRADRQKFPVPRAPTGAMLIRLEKAIRKGARRGDPASEIIAEFAERERKRAETLKKYRRRYREWINDTLGR